MDGYTWTLSAIYSLFQLFNVSFLGVPAYTFLVTPFVFYLLANFMQGRK